MGRIKTTVIKRSAERLIASDVEFTTDFEKNKKIIEGVMPSKRMRNMVAGYITRLKERMEGKDVNPTIHTR